MRPLSTALFLAKVALTLAVAGYLGVCALLYVFQARFLFPGAFAPLPPGMDTKARQFGLTPTTISTPDGESIYLLHWAPDPGKPVIIIFHGNASYPEDYGFLYAGWVVAGHGIVAPVARGYPRSSGEPNGNGMLADALAVRDWVAKTYPGHPVFVFGQSLGTGSAVHVAAHRKVAGVVLVSPFTSMLALVTEKMPWLPVRLLLASPFRSDLDIPSVKAPVLIFHGDRDTLIPIAHGQALAALAKSPVTFETVADAGHAEGLLQLPMIDRIATFLIDN